MKLLLVAITIGLIAWWIGIPAWIDMLVVWGCILSRGE